LVALAEAYDTRGRTGEREPIVFARSSGGTDLLHDALREELDPKPGIGDLEELDAEGLISMTWRQPNSGNFRVTGEGFAYVLRLQEHERQLARAAEVSPSDLDWIADVLPVLGVIVDEYPSVPATRGVEQGVVNERLGRPKNDAGTDRAVFQLEQGGYVTGTRVAQMAGPVLVVPTPKALQILRGWPVEGGDAAAVAFIAAIRDSLAKARTPEEKSRLQTLLDAALEVGTQVVANVLTKVATGV
jgi:hypothetical protein